jgi:hypothetical protein
VLLFFSSVCIYRNGEFLTDKNQALLAKFRSIRIITPDEELLDFFLVIWILWFCLVFDVL